MSSTPFLGDAYSPPAYIPDLQSVQPTQPPILNRNLPPPLPSKVGRTSPVLPPKPKDLMKEISQAKVFPVITYYENLSTSDVQMSKEEPCHVPYELTGNIDFTVLPIPQIDYPVISKEAAVEAFMNDVNSRCCWDHSYLSNLIILSDEMCYCYKIVLDNYFEARSASWEEELLTDQYVSSPNSGMAPHPWELIFPEEPMFEDRVRTAHVPFTDVIKTCSNCCGSGRSICPSCKGTGSFPCPTCKGEKRENVCPTCMDGGVVSCKHCQGLGNLTCSCCNGKGKKKQFIQVKSEYRTHTLQSAIERGGLISEYLSLLTGKQVYCCRGRRLEEADCFYDSEVNNEIRRLLYEASQLEHEYEVLGHQQQLTVSIIPVRILTCQSGEHIFNVSVFDLDHKVFCPDYPVQRFGFWNNLTSKCSIM